MLKASNLQAFTHVPHNVQLSKTLAFLVSGYTMIAAKGHTFSQTLHPVHASMSTSSIFTHPSSSYYSPSIPEVFELQF